MNAELYVPLVEKLSDDDFFTIEQLTAADDLAKRDPGKLTDRMLRMLATYDAGAAQVFARKRAEARATPAAPPPAPAAPRAAAQSTARMKTGESLEDFAKRAPLAPTPVVMFRGLISAVTDLAKKEREKREELEARVERLEFRLIVMNNEIEVSKDLHTKAAPRGVAWGGEHASGKSYSAGEFVKRAGSIWLALKDTTSTPGMDASGWELVLKGQYSS